MVLVDTSVLIEYLSERRNSKTDIFEQILADGISFGISVFTYQEVLQGARDEREYRRLRGYLDALTIYSPSRGTETYEKAARLFYTLRRQGITVRGTIDMLIALTAIENDFMLLRNDHDFDAIAAKTPELKILAKSPAS